MVLREVLLAASSSGRVESVVRTAGVTRRLVSRYVAGTTAEDAASAAEGVVADGLLVTFDRLGEEGRGAGQAARAVEDSLALLDGLARRGIAKGADLTLRLTALGLNVGEQLARENAARVCEAASEAGATVTVDTEGVAPAEAALRVHAALLEDHPSTGVAVRSSLRGAEDHCRSLSGARVRLSRGPVEGPAPVAYNEVAEIDRSYVRCLRVLMSGQGYPMVATHDRRLIEVASALAVLNEREPGGFEYQMAYGVRRSEQRRLADLGSRVRVRIPYGTDWYGHLTRRLAERPANLTLLARSLAGR
ncbi:proline dehydrogenase family protein [Sphaerisporangium corydalis]|uniref:Proline dehydrogenase family protein n=1 Tax=Sphaerisporangium corydalis TaxID=1441875 RepID=A0ABV9EHH2_9ACTN|nr:proline dehydrogenase family protein [Sphaerisporangium corydalis]